MEPASFYEALGGSNLRIDGTRRSPRMIYGTKRSGKFHWTNNRFCHVVVDGDSVVEMNSPEASLQFCSKQNFNSTL